MAFQAKDGSRHTNIDSMRHADAAHMAKQPSPAKPMPEHEDGEPSDTEGAHDPQALEQLKQSFDSVMQALASGQQPDQETVKALIETFNSFITEEEHEQGAGYPEPY